MIFFHPDHSLLSPTPLINYWRKFSIRVWNDILMLISLRFRKRSGPSVVCLGLQVQAKKPTQCFVLKVSIKKPTYCQLLTSFRRSNRMFVDVFIECVAWSYWWTWCVLPIICNWKHFSFFAFYFNVSNKISSTPPLLLNLRVLNSRLIWICKILYWCSLFLF